MRVGIMTGGGDAPGLNGIIEAVSRSVLNQSPENRMVGILDGFEGVFGMRTREIKFNDVLGIHCEAGTFLGTTNKSRIAGRSEEFQAAIQKMNLDCLIAAGGDGTFSALKQLAPSLPIIGVPKTIDNDLPGTEITFGFDTACSVVADSVDALRSTAEAHSRVMIVETMGRTAGWIALGGGMASYADAILIPERPFSRPKFLDFLKAKRAAGKRGLVVVVSEAAKAEKEDATVAFRVEESVQQERFGGIAEKLARWIEKETGWESRHVVLGHLQRSRSPTTTDRFLTASMGTLAGNLAVMKKWNRAVVYREGRVLDVPLTDIQGDARIVETDHRWVKVCLAQGIFI
ncbi:MAG: 6-phosphofructokinase [Bdellovibrionales bacterium]|nr:6-phosphofructokinase [Bdellovibrionales bacterium]